MIITESIKPFGKELNTRDKERSVVVYDKNKNIIFNDEVKGVVKSPHSIRAGTKAEIDTHISDNDLKPADLEAQAIIK